MGFWTVLGRFVTENSRFSYWLIALVISGISFAGYRGYFRARKIQPKGFRWKTFRNEIFFAIINLAVAGTVLRYPGESLFFVFFRKVSG
jgi:lathosterol oxidase